MQHVKVTFPQNITRIANYMFLPLDYPNILFACTCFGHFLSGYVGMLYASVYLFPVVFRHTGHRK